MALERRRINGSVYGIVGHEFQTGYNDFDLEFLCAQIEIESRYVHVLNTFQQDVFQLQIVETVNKKTRLRRLDMVFLPDYLRVRSGMPTPRGLARRVGVSESKTIYFGRRHLKTFLLAMRTTANHERNR